MMGDSKSKSVEGNSRMVSSSRRGRGGRRSLRVLFASSLAAVFALSVLLFGAATYVERLSSLKASLGADAKRVADSLSVTLAFPLTFDLDSAYRILEGEMANPNVKAILVHDGIGGINAGLVRLADGTIIRTDSAPSLDQGKEQYFRAQSDVLVQSSRVASIETFEVIGRELLILNAELLKSLALVVVVILGCVIAAFSAFESQVMRRLRRLGAALKDFSADLAFEPVAATTDDEIGDLGTAFNLLARRVSEYSQRMEGIVKERTERLVQVERFAFLGSMVAGVAHEINTPTGVSISAASSLRLSLKGLESDYQSGELTEEAFRSSFGGLFEAVDILETNLARVSELVKTFKEVAADQAIEDPREFDVGKYLEEIVFSLKPRLKHSSHRVLVDCPRGLVVTGLPGVLYQVVTNLIMNSVVHAFEPGESGTITIAAARAEDGIRVSHKDNGKGIPPGLEERVFEPFFTTRRGQGGTGLGLYIARNLLVKIGGSIACFPAEPRGADFVIHFPCRIK